MTLELRPKCANWYPFKQACFSHATCVHSFPRWGDVSPCERGGVRDAFQGQWCRDSIGLNGFTVSMQHLARHFSFNKRPMTRMRLRACKIDCWILRKLCNQWTEYLPPVITCAVLSQFWCLWTSPVQINPLRPRLMRMMIAGAKLSNKKWTFLPSKLEWKVCINNLYMLRMSTSREVVEPATKSKRHVLSSHCRNRVQNK